MTSLDRVIERNLSSVKERLVAACRRAGRRTSEVTLVGVTKYAQMDWVQKLMALGVQHFGESRPQQLIARVAQMAAVKIPSAPPAELVHWHLIGHLQRNKVRVVLPVVSLIHSVDSLRLLDQIERVADELDLRPRVLIEVNLTGDPKKHGFSRDDLLENWSSALAVRRVQITGLMTMAAFSENPEESRATFADLRTLRDQLVQMSPAGINLPELSMGMTGDFEVAIEEGATIVRIGSALWEGLGASAGQPPQPLV